MAATSNDLAKRKAPAAAAFSIPREHGAWAMLGTAVFAGLAGAEHIDRLHAPLAAAALALFFVQDPLRAAARARSLDPASLPSIALWGACALAAAAWLLAWGAPLGLLAVFGALGAAGLGAEAWILSRRRERTIAGELLAVGLLSLPAGAGPLLSLGSSVGPAFALWTLCFLFLGGSVFSVKLLVRARRWAGASWRQRLAANRGSLAWLAASLAMTGACAFGGWLPAAAPIALAPALVRAIRTLGARPEPPSLTRIGIWELVNCLVFCALVATAYATA